ncbi:hypothetical protein MMC28_004036 [Mycoblastus sanguinarius]|nr:hypothetical protein [Mycoblastus sanguinarius]
MHLLFSFLLFIVAAIAQDATTTTPATPDPAIDASASTETIVDACGPTIPDPSVQDSCYSPVAEVDSPNAYGVQCLNDTNTAIPINVTSCAQLIPLLCSQEWQEAGQWLWISNEECTLGSFLPPYAGSAQWPTGGDCEELIYVSMINECAYSGVPYNLAAVNLATLPDNTPSGKGAAVNVGYGSYIVSTFQPRNLSDANCQTPAGSTSCASTGKSAVNLQLPASVTPVPTS